MRLKQAVTLTTALSVVGVFAIFSTALYLWALWTTDPLKSIGGFIPVISLVLILRVWRSLGWEMRGTWWGLAVVAAIVALVHVRDHAILEFILSPSWAIFLPPHSLVAFGYTAGVVLLFGGVRLFRAAVFPIALTWFVNPVPNFFTTHIELRLMFTPDFGMFIAPGCDGIRGAITMGFIALIAGYIYKFRARVWVLMVLGAIALGYVFNLVRLCVLVLYYIVAVHVPWLQSRAEMGDYIIGACLFFVATTLLFTVIRRWSPGHEMRPPKLSLVQQPAEAAPRNFVPRWAALALVLAVGSVSYARALIRAHESPQVASDANAMGRFPKRVGNFTLQREWNEYLVTGGLIFYWADYVADKASPLAPGHGGGVQEEPAVVSVGISPVLGAHDTLLCHSARGEDWLWHGDLEFSTAKGTTSFSGSFYNGGATQYIEATTVCTGGSCGQSTTGRTHFGFVYSRPDTRTLLSQSPTRPIPVLLRTETLDTAMAADRARAELVGNLRDFLAAANLSEFTAPYR
jgi:exosortase J